MRVASSSVKEKKYRLPDIVKTSALFSQWKVAVLKCNTKWGEEVLLEHTEMWKLRKLIIKKLKMKMFFSTRM